MEKINSLLIHPVLKAFVPVLIGGSYHLFKETLGATNQGSYTKQQFPDDAFQDHFQMNPEEMPFGLLSKLNQITFGIYSNFFSFLLAMLFIEGFFKILECGIRYFSKEEANSFNERSCDYSFSQKRRGTFYSKSEKFFMKILSYALIFILFQIADLCFLSFSASQTSFISRHSESQIFADDHGASRILEEQLSISDDKNILLSASKSSPSTPSDKISLSMGSILSSLSLNVDEMILSKDRNIAYVTLDYYATLKVIDISDLQSPSVIGTLNLQSSTGTYGYRLKNLLLSSDEKTLYASNSRDIEIIDITDASSPNLISMTRSEIFLDKAAIDEVTKYVKTSLAVQEATKTLFIGGMGLQIYDISDPRKPVLLKAVKNELKPNYGLSRNEICLSQDGQILFIANGTLDLYNISNPNEMKLLNSFTMESSPRSLLLSEDGKTLFLIGNSAENDEVVFEEADISDLNSLKIKKTMKFAQGSTNSPRFLAISPCKSKLFVLADFGYKDGIDLLVLDRIKETAIKNENSLVENAFAMGFSTDGRTLITASSSQFMTIELFLDYPNRRTFSESLDNLISNFSLPGRCSKMQISNDEKYLFISRSDNRINANFYPTFEIWDLKNQKSVSLYNWTQSIKQIHLANNDDTVYLVGDNSILMLDVNNRSFINVKKTYNTLNQDERFQHFTTSSDEKAGFVVVSLGDFENVTYFDLSQESSYIKGVSLRLKTRPRASASKLIMKDDKTLIIVFQEGFLMYDVSDIHSPMEIASLFYDAHEPVPELFSPALSEDKKTLYIETSDLNGYHKLRVYDVSDSKLPQLISEKDLSKREHYSHRPGISLSNRKGGFIYQNNSLVRLNVTNLKEIKISGIIPLSSDQKNEVSNYQISPDGQTIYISIESQIRILNMNIKYSLFLKQEKFLLGEKSTGQIALLNLVGGDSDYNLIGPESYKIIKLSLLSMNVATNKISLEVTKSPLPSWIAFDRESDSLTVEAKKQRDIGTHTLHSAFSLKIPRDVFKSLNVSSNNLWAWLISLDYVDPQLFLTANFGSEDDFFLPDQFEAYKVQVYNILKTFYFETCTGFEVASSLEFQENKNSLKISTLTTTNIKVEVKLEPKEGSDVKFVSCPYGSLVPVVKNNIKTKMSLEGSTKEINSALNSIVVNFENGGYCDAILVINDGFNPIVSVELKNISRYFKANEPPRLNSRIDTTLQEQIDGVDIQTGVYFTLTLTDDIFKDEYIENLRYVIVMAKNNTALPSWLSFSGLTLKGTPPEQILGRDIDLMLIAKNEFKESRVPLRLHVKMSLAFYLQLLLKYIPYILTIVGLMASANKIFNIVEKRQYKHPKEYEISVGEEISPEVIQPVAFIREELAQGRLILKYLLRTQKSRKENLTSLIDPSTKTLNKQRVLDNIKVVIHQMSSNDKQKLTKYPSPIIDRIIVNQFVLMQLESIDEVKTKAFFAKIEPSCMEVVEQETSSSLEFSVNQNKLEKLIRKMGMSSGSTNLEESLIRDDYSSSLPVGVNINLLKDAILGIAFDNHTLDISPISLNIEVKQKVPSNFLFRFLKCDLRDIYLNDKNRINYGINYQINDDKLCFYGVAQNYFRGKTLVVQVKNAHHRIMKEIWIHGVSNDFQGNESFVIRDEHEARGQGYEIF